jgi:hypothetical protein
MHQTIFIKHELIKSPILKSKGHYNKPRNKFFDKQKTFTNFDFIQESSSRRIKNIKFISLFRKTPDFYWGNFFTNSIKWLKFGIKVVFMMKFYRQFL